MSNGRPLPARAGYHLAACVLLAAAATAVYWPGLTGPFLFDDFGNITHNQRIRIGSLDPATLWQAARSGEAGPSGRPLAMLTFALDYYSAGQAFDAFTFKRTNLAIHLVNAILVYLVAVRLAAGLAAPGRAGTGRTYLDHLPLVVAALWTLHPLQLTSVLYVVQRMTSLSTLCLLAGLYLFLVGRDRLGRAPGRSFVLMGLGLAAGTGVGVLAKENAALLPGLAFLVEVCFYRRAGLAAEVRHGLWTFYGVAVFAPALAGLVYLAVNPEYVTSVYALREFTLVERLMTEARVLFFYLGLLFFPHLRSFGLYHGDFALSTGLTDPPTTLVAVVAWIAIAAAVAWNLRHGRVWAFAAAWFLVGHALESTVIALELVHEHRNYLPSFGVLFGAGYYGLGLLARTGASPRIWWPAVAVSVAVVGFVTLSRATIWGDGETLARITARNHPAESRALGLVAASRMMRGDDVHGIYRAFRDAAAADPKTVYQLVEMAKIVAGAEALLARVPGAAVRGADSPAPLLRRELLVRPDALERTRREVHREIEHRLARHVVTGETTRSLVELQTCSRAAVDVCAALFAPALAWHRAALANPRVSSRNRAWLALSAAKLHAHRGDIPRAVALVREAMAHDPEEPGFPLQLADLFLFLGWHEEAESIIAGLEAQRGHGPLWRERIAAMRGHLERARSGAAAGAGR